MFIEESDWINGVLGAIDLRRGASALDIGSSTLDYRMTEQPHIEQDVLVPLRSRGVERLTLDIKKAPGVDFVCDITSPGFDGRRDLGRLFELVLCTNVLLHVGDLPRAISAVKSLVAPHGYLVVSVPGSYRWTPDPLDNGFRPDPETLIESFQGSAGEPELTAVRADTLRIDDARYYKGLVSRASSVRVGRRWLPLPGGSEQIRYLVRPFRWKQTCVLFRKGSDGAENGARGILPPS
jgi:hypothetical protein